MLKPCHVISTANCPPRTFFASPSTPKITPAAAFWAHTHRHSHPHPPTPHTPNRSTALRRSWRRQSAWGRTQRAAAASPSELCSSGPRQCWRQGQVGARGGSWGQARRRGLGRLSQAAAHAVVHLPRPRLVGNHKWGRSAGAGCKPVLSCCGCKARGCWHGANFSGCLPTNSPLLPSNAGVEALAQYELSGCLPVY